MKIEPQHIVRKVQSIAQGSGALAFLDQGIVSGFNFLTFLLMARWLPSAEFGVYLLAFSALLFAQAVQHALVTRGHNVLGAGVSDSRRRSYSAAALAASIMVALVSTGLAAAAGLLFDLAGWDTAAAVSWGVSIVVGAWLLHDCFRRILYTKDALGTAALIDGFMYGGLFVLVLFGDPLGLEATATTVFTFSALSALAAIAVAFPFLRSELIRPDRRLVKKAMAQLFRYGRWLTKGEIIGWIGQNGNAWLIAYFFGAPLVAAYKAATYIPNLLNPFEMAVNNWMPVKAASIENAEDKGAMTTWLRRKALLLMAGYGVVVLFIALLPGFILDLFYDGLYSSPLLSLVLTITVISRLVGFSFGFAKIGLMATAHTKPIFTAQVVVTVAFAATATFMIPWLGIVGAPISRLFMNAVVGVYLLYAFRQSTSMSPTPRSVPA